LQCFEEFKPYFFYASEIVHFMLDNKIAIFVTNSEARESGLLFINQDNTKGVVEVLETVKMLTKGMKNSEKPLIVKMVFSNSLPAYLPNVLRECGIDNLKLQMTQSEVEIYFYTQTGKLLIGEIVETESRKKGA